MKTIRVTHGRSTLDKRICRLNTVSKAPKTSFETALSPPPTLSLSTNSLTTFFLPLSISTYHYHLSTYFQKHPSLSSQIKYAQGHLGNFLTPALNFLFGRQFSSVFHLHNLFYISRSRRDSGCSHFHRRMKKSTVADESRRPKFREVSSRYLHNIPSSPQIVENYSSLPLPNPSNSAPSWHIKKSSPSVPESRKHRSHDSGLLRKLWPSAGKSSRNGEKESKNSDNSMSLNRQKSCSTVFSRFESSPQINGSNSTSSGSSKENYKPFFGGSMRYTGKFKFPGRSSSPSPVAGDDDFMIPGRMSVDETALRQRSFGGRSSDLSDNQDSGSECSDHGSNTSLGSPFIGKNSPASYMSPTVSSSFRKSGLDASPNDQRHRRGTSETNIVTDNFKKINLKNSVKRANSLTAPSKKSSPSHSNLKPPSPPHMNAKPPTSPSSKGKLPPTSPSRSKGVGSFISLGLDLFKHKKPYPSSIGSGTVGASGTNTTAESVHQLRMLHNRLMQWKYTNARGAVVNQNLTTQAEV